MKNITILLILILTVTLTNSAFAGEVVGDHYSVILDKKINAGIREIDIRDIDPVAGTYINKSNGDELVINCQVRIEGECLKAHISIKYNDIYYSFYTYKKNNFLTIDFQSLKTLKKRITNTENCYFNSKYTSCSYSYFSDQNYLYLSNYVLYFAIEKSPAYLLLLVTSLPLDIATVPLSFLNAVRNSIKRGVIGAKSKRKWKYLLKTKFTGTKEITDSEFDYMLRSVFTVAYSNEF
jgi:hypothetical protein